MWTKVAGLILRYRALIIIISAILTVGMGYMASTVKLSYEYASLLPQKDTAYVEYQAFKKHFGQDANIMVIGIQDSSFFELEKFNDYLTVCDSIKHIAGVEGLVSVGQAYKVKKHSSSKISFVPFFEEHPKTQEELDSISADVLQQEFYKGFLYNDTSHVYLIALTINQKILDSPAREGLIANVVGQFSEFSKKYNEKIVYSGLPYIRTQISLKLRKELSLFIILAGLICAIILYLFFRSLKLVLFSMLIVGISVIWVIGWMGVFEYNITVLNSLLPPLIIVIGVPNSVFFLNKYHQEYVIHGNKIKALQRVIRKIGNATFLTNLTTASGFATFIITDSKILQEFGVVSFLGIIGVFVFSLLLIPAVFSYLKPPTDKQVKHLDNKGMNGIVKLLINVALKHRKWVYIGAVTALSLGVWGISMMKSTGYMVDDLPHNDPILTNLKFIEKNFNGVLPLEIQINVKDTLVSTDFKKFREVLRQIDFFEDSLKNYTEVSQPLSLLEFFKFVRQGNNKTGNPNSYRLYRSSELYIPQQVQNLSLGNSKNKNLQTALIDSTKLKYRIKCSVKDIGTVKMEQLEQDLQRDLNQVFPDSLYSTKITGSSIVFFKGTKYLIKNLFQSLLLAILLIALFMAWMFRSKRMVLVSLLPNLLPLILTAALMGFFEIPIKPSTILVFSIAFGISVDDTIHFLAKYRQELTHTNWNIGKSVVLALKETGTSMIYTSVILFFGFGIFIASQFGGTVALGSLVAVTLLVAMLSNLLLLPALLLTLEKAITNKSFKEPLLHIFNEEEDIELDDLKILSKTTDED